MVEMSDVLRVELKGVSLAESSAYLRVEYLVELSVELKVSLMVVSMVDW